MSLVGRGVSRARRARARRVSEPSGRSSPRCGVPPARSRSCPNPVDLDEFDAAADGGTLPRSAGGSATHRSCCSSASSRRASASTCWSRASRSSHRADARLVIAGNDMGAAPALERAGRAGSGSRRVRRSPASCAAAIGSRRWPTPTSSSIPPSDEIFGLVPLEALLARHAGHRRRRLRLRRDRRRHRRRHDRAARRRRGAAPPRSTSMLRRRRDWRVARRAAASRVRAALLGATSSAEQLEAVYRAVSIGGRPAATSRMTAWHRRQLRRARATTARRGSRDVLDAIRRAGATAGPSKSSSSTTAARMARAASSTSSRATGRVACVDGAGRGAAAAINLGVRAPRASDHLPGRSGRRRRAGLDASRCSTRWTIRDVAAAQGYYVARSRRASFWARVMGARPRAALCGDREARRDHVCTGNTAYRARGARSRSGLFDEDLGYGYDNDMSYRLQAAGYRLVFCRDARSRASLARRAAWLSAASSTASATAASTSSPGTRLASPATPCRRPG